MGFCSSCGKPAAPSSKFCSRACASAEEERSGMCWYSDSSSDSSSTRRPAPRRRATKHRTSSGRRLASRDGVPSLSSGRASFPPAVAVSVANPSPRTAGLPLWYEIDPDRLSVVESLDSAHMGGESANASDVERGSSFSSSEDEDDEDDEDEEGSLESLSRAFPLPPSASPQPERRGSAPPGLIALQRAGQPSPSLFSVRTASSAETAPDSLALDFARPAPDDMYSLSSVESWECPSDGTYHEDQDKAGRMLTSPSSSSPRPPRSSSLRPAVGVTMATAVAAPQLLPNSGSKNERLPLFKRMAALRTNLGKGAAPSPPPSPLPSHSPTPSFSSSPTSPEESPRQRRTSRTGMRTAFSALRKGGGSDRWEDDLDEEEDEDERPRRRPPISKAAMVLGLPVEAGGHSERRSNHTASEVQPAPGSKAALLLGLDAPARQLEPGSKAAMLLGIDAPAPPAHPRARSRSKAAAVLGLDM